MLGAGRHYMVMVDYRKWPIVAVVACQGSAVVVGALAALLVSARVAANIHTFK